MRFQGTSPMAEAMRREYARLVAACAGDAEMADDVIGFLVDGSPSLDDLRRLVAHAREVAADIEAEGRKRS